MRSSDIARLSTPIPEEDQRGQDQQFHEALDIVLPRWRALSALVRADLERSDAGVSWWRSLDPVQRQLISYQLVESLATVPALLARARLHLFEVAHASELINASPHSRVVVPRNSEPREVLLRYESAAEHLPLELEQLHIAGLIHSLFSAFDVLGAVIVGVAGLPKSILKADFARALEALERPPKTTPAAQCAAWLQLHQQITATLAVPPDWHGWLSDLRNTVAHRAKIPLVHLVSPTRPIARTVEGDVYDVLVETRLPRHPGRAFVQSLSATPHELCLDEPAIATLEAALNASVVLIESASVWLSDVWARRRSGDLQFEQPAAQWAMPEVGPARAFFGFAPSKPITGSARLTMSPDAFSALHGTGAGKRG